jgi:hypothetical protein
VRRLAFLFVLLSGCSSATVSDTGSGGDDARPDARAPDAAVTLDAANEDAVSPDASPVDAEADDAGREDATREDASALDVVSADVPPPDSGTCEGAPPSCRGVCALVGARCDGTSWVCDQGPGHETIESSCDGFDNDCDGQSDEGCVACTVNETEISSRLQSIADIDFDYACNAYLTSLISGPDFAWIVPSSATVAPARYFGNSNQNMGFGLVDPDPTQRRMIVVYSCCSRCNCLSQNGLTLLYTCGRNDPSCGCSGQTNCPGFLDAPFLAAAYEDTTVRSSNFVLSTPTGLAQGPGGTTFVGNWRPASCSNDASCVRCDPSSPSTWCRASDAPCCDTTALGRLAEFTAPGAGTEAAFRVVHIFQRETIVGLASGRRGEIMVGTSSAGTGNLYRFDPIARTTTHLASFRGFVFSVTQDRRTGDWFIEEVGTSSSTIHRRSEAGGPLALPNTVPANPPGQGVLQYGPDGRLYRLRWSIDGTSLIDAFTLP